MGVSWYTVVDIGAWWRDCLSVGEGAGCVLYCALVFFVIKLLWMYGITPSGGREESDNVRCLVSAVTRDDVGDC